MPLDGFPTGRQHGRSHGNLVDTGYLSDRLLRLPLFPSLTPEQVEFVIEAIEQFFGNQSSS